MKVKELIEFLNAQDPDMECLQVNELEGGPLFDSDYEEMEMPIVMPVFEKDGMLRTERNHERFIKWARLEDSASSKKDFLLF